jgi:hypothetical protein
VLYLAYAAAQRSAADLAAARKWYSEVLGVEPNFERPELDGRIRWRRG